MNIEMNDEVRDFARAEIARQNLNKGSLAESIKISRAHLSKMLHGHTEGSFQAWQLLYQELGYDLEPQIVKRDKQ